MGLFLTCRKINNCRRNKYLDEQLIRVTNQPSMTNNCSNSPQHPSLFFSYELHLCILCTYLSSYFLKHLANRSIMASSRVRQSLQPALFYIVSSSICLGLPNSLLFGPTYHISHVYPPLTTRRLNTTIQEKNMGMLHLMYDRRTYIHHIISAILILSS